MKKQFRLNLLTEELALAKSQIVPVPNKWSESSGTPIQSTNFPTDKATQSVLSICLALSASKAMAKDHGKTISIVIE